MAAGALRVTVGGAHVWLDPAEEHLVGRLPSASVLVDNDQVSRRQARLAVEDDCWVLEDLGSANGTFVDGQRVGRVDIRGPTEVVVGGAERGVTILLAPTSDVPAAPVDEPPRLERPTRVHPLRDEIVRIGRADDNTIVLNDLAASRHHAELHRTAAGIEVRDLGSANGTFVDGHRVTRRLLHPGDVVAVGSRMLVVHDDRVEEHGDGTHFPIAAEGLRVETADGTVLLDDVSLVAGESSMVAILGPSGAGKSTLLDALTGRRPAGAGRVWCGGVDLYANQARLRGRIGFVPQDDLVQPELTVAQSLHYAARLRFPRDTPAAERSARVREVMGELGLAHRADVRVGSLSGGQRKRVSVALELLTRPSVLVLDEPTSGLDPGYERSVMQLLRRLADGGRTVIVVTHSTESLHLCDRLLCLAPGGRVAWFGPPEETAAFFGMEGYQQIFQALDSAGAGLEPDRPGLVLATPEAWSRRYAEHPARARFLDRPLEVHSSSRSEEIVLDPPPAGSWWRQLATLTSRYARIVASDRRTLLLLLVTAPVLGFMLMIRLPPDQFRGAGESVPLFSQAPLVLFVVAIGLTQVGISTAAREIVKERAIVERERSVGVATTAYVLSKVLVLGALAWLQAGVVVLVATARQGDPGDGAALGSARLELVVAGALVTLGAMACGLLVSAVARSADRVALVVPAVLGFHLLVASGEVFPGAPTIPVVEQVQHASTARWGFAAMSSTVDVERLALANRLVDRAPDLTLDEAAELAERVLDAGSIEALADEAPPSSEFSRSAAAWRGDVVALGALTVVLLGATVVALRRDPR